MRRPSFRIPRRYKVALGLSLVASLLATGTLAAPPMAPELLLHYLPEPAPLNDPNAAVPVPPDAVVDVTDLGDGSALATLLSGATKRYAITDPVTWDNGDGTASTLYVDGGIEVWRIPDPEAPPALDDDEAVTIRTSGWSVAGPISAAGFSWPLATHSRSGYDYSAWHPGVDFACTYGQPVLAAAPGVVTFADWTTTGYGYRVIVQDARGWKVTANHLSRIDVLPGSRVLRGQRIGACGSSGRSSGPHNHAEFVSPSGAYVSPWSVLPPA